MSMRLDVGQCARQQSLQKMSAELSFVLLFVRKLLTQIGRFPRCHLCDDPLFCALQIRLRILFRFGMLALRSLLFLDALVLRSLLFLDTFLLGGSCSGGLGLNLCRVVTESRLNIVGQLGKIELGNTFLRPHNDSVRLHPHDRRVLVLFPFSRFEVVGQRD